VKADQEFIDKVKLMNDSSFDSEVLPLIFLLIGGIFISVGPIISIKREQESFKIIKRTILLFYVFGILFIIISIYFQSAMPRTTFRTEMTVSKVGLSEPSYINSTCYCDEFSGPNCSSLDDYKNKCGGGQHCCSEKNISYDCVEICDSNNTCRNDCKYAMHCDTKVNNQRCSIQYGQFKKDVIGLMHVGIDGLIRVYNSSFVELPELLGVKRGFFIGKTFDGHIKYKTIANDIFIDDVLLYNQGEFQLTYVLLYLVSVLIFFVIGFTVFLLRIVHLTNPMDSENNISSSDKVSSQNESSHS